MSAGEFTKSRYAASYGAGTAIHPIRVQPETISLTINSVPNDPPAGAITNPISALVSRGKRAKGLIARTVTLRAPFTGQPTDYVPGGLTTIPCLNVDIYNAAVAADDDTDVSYLGNTGYRVAGFSPEIAR